MPTLQNVWIRAPVRTTLWQLLCWHIAVPESNPLYIIYSFRRFVRHLSSVFIHLFILIHAIHAFVTYMYWLPYRSHSFIHSFPFIHLPICFIIGQSIMFTGQQKDLKMLVYKFYVSVSDDTLISISWIFIASSPYTKNVFTGAFSQIHHVINGLVEQICDGTFCWSWVIVPYF